MTLSQKALDFAQARHQGQFRRDGVTPYFSHCEKVASLIEDEELKAAAYCHDLIEDGRASYEEIRQELGAGIADAVVILTHNKEESYTEYVRRIRESAGGRMVPVKLADITANLSDSPTPSQVQKYYQALLILADK